MVKLLRARGLGLWVAIAVLLYGFCSLSQQIATLDSPSSLRSGRSELIWRESILTIGFFGLAGFLVGLLVTAIQSMVLRLERLEERLTLETERWDHRFESLAASLSALKPGAMGTRDGIAELPSGNAPLLAISVAIREQDWKEAVRLLDELGADDRNALEIERLRTKVETGRKNAIETQLERINASKEVSDAGRVLELYEEISQILDPDLQRTLKSDLARWFMVHIQKKLRSGTIQPEVVKLSSRVSEVFDGTSEGASLRAGLHTLRRTIGLCPRCGEPYAGIDNACPNCMARSMS